MRSQIWSIWICVLAIGLASGCKRSSSMDRDGSTRGDSTMDLHSLDGESTTDVQTPDGPAPVAWVSRVSGTNKNLLGVWATQQAIVAVGDEGTIVRSEDGGETWSPASSTTTNNLRSVYGDGAEFFAVGSGGTILHSTDKGVTWQAQTAEPAGTKTLLDVWGASGAAVYIIGGKTMSFSMDHGQSWQSRSDPSGFGLNAIWGASANELVACGEMALYLSLDGGQSWETLGSSLASQNDVWTAKPLGSDGILSANGSGLVTYMRLLEGDGGFHLGGVSKDSLSNLPLFGLWGPDASAQQDLFVVGDGGEIFHRVAKDWLTDESGTSEPLYDVHGTDQLAIAVGANGTICTRSLP